MHIVYTRNGCVQSYSAFYNKISYTSVILIFAVSIHLHCEQNETLEIFCKKSNFIELQLCEVYETQHTCK